MQRALTPRAILALLVAVGPALQARAATEAPPANLPVPIGAAGQACPGPYILNEPWYPDPQSCSCYLVCGRNGGAVRMCCPEGLWWDNAERACLYPQDVAAPRRRACLGLSLGQGTTKQLREIFLGRCWEYQRFVNPESFREESMNCESLFDAFAAVFMNKAACQTVTPDDYSDLVRDATMNLPPDQQVFWSGAYTLAQDFVARGKRGYTLETTLIGYTLNDVTWCGEDGSPGINFESCPAFASCPNHVMASFWAKALESYAAQAQGVVTVILNGSRTDGAAFRNSSFFAEHELPNLDPGKVKVMRVWVAHDLDRDPIETCLTGHSLQELRVLAEGRGLATECYDNPPELVHLLCADSPYAKHCSMLSGQPPVQANDV